MSINTDHGLKWSRVGNTYVIARDPDQGLILIGGLGGLGVGAMWMKESSEDKQRYGYGAASIRIARPDEFGVSLS